ncbi:beta-ketoacyl synthase N-terminal-like domain-containing protein [Streptomyces sp. NBC_00454]|uniref:beta-ketoacyl synthase N-terminal-like domain-containing protein n=1 Tax=Streptomyces sp. NBC_00454 TaxID=2975747 RepID=UPI0030DE2070
MTGFTPLDIEACGVLSPAGFGLTALGTALRTGQPGHADPAGIGTEPFPARTPVRVVPDLAVTERLGRKGTRNLDRTTVLGLLAVQEAITALGEEFGEDGRDQTGVVFGTSAGGTGAIGDFARDTVVQERPYLVNPAQFSNLVLNCCASQIAIRHRFTGVNATMVGGHLSGLLAWRYARNTLRLGRARRLFVGAVEELSPQSAWAWRRSGALRPRSAVGEGAAMFSVTPAGQGKAPLARVVACEVGFHAPSGTAGQNKAALALASCVERALDTAGVDRQQITTVAVGASAQSGLGEIEQEALALALGDSENRQQLVISDVLGETYGASTALQLAALLAVWQEEPVSDAGEYGLVTSYDRDGGLGCLLVQRPN